MEREKEKAKETVKEIDRKIDRYNFEGRGREIDRER